MLIYILLFFVFYTCPAASDESGIKQGSVAKAIATWQTLDKKAPAKKSTLRDQWFMPEKLSPAEQKSLIRTHSDPQRQLSHAMFSEHWSAEYTDKCRRAVHITGTNDHPILFYITKTESHTIALAAPEHIQAYGVGINRHIADNKCYVHRALYYLLSIVQSKSGSLLLPSGYPPEAITMQARLFASYYGLLFNRPDWLTQNYFEFLYIPPANERIEGDNIAEQKARLYSLELFCRLSREHPKLLWSAFSIFKSVNLEEARQIGNVLISSMCQDYMKEQETGIEQFPKPDSYRVLESLRSIKYNFSYD